MMQVEGMQVSHLSLTQSSKSEKKVSVINETLAMEREQHSENYYQMLLQCLLCRSMQLNNEHIIISLCYLSDTQFTYYVEKASLPKLLIYSKAIREIKHFIVFSYLLDFCYGNMLYECLLEIDIRAYRCVTDPNSTILRKIAGRRKIS